MAKHYSLKERKNSYKVAGKITFFTFLTILTIIWVLPFLLMLNTSFVSTAQLSTYKIFHLPSPFTGENYVDAFNALNFWQSFFTSVLVTIISNLVIIFFSSLAAWQLARMKTWYSKAIFYTLLIVMIVPFQAIMLPLVTIMGKMNFINLPGLIFMYSGFGMSISIFMMHGFLKSIPVSLEEAAKVEGYNPIQVYFKIIIHLLKPIITTIVIINTMWIWNDFLLPYLVFQKNGDLWTTTVVMLYTSLVGTHSENITGLMAGLTILIIPATVFFIVLQKNIVAGITAGAVK